MLPRTNAKNLDSNVKNGDDNLIVIQLYGSSIWKKDEPIGETLNFVGLKRPAIVHNDGLLITALDGSMVCLFYVNKTIIQKIPI